MKKTILLSVAICAIVLLAACGGSEKNNKTTVIQMTSESMDFLELTKQRYSERFFDSTRMVEDEKLDRILEAGRQAPTAANK